MEGLVNIINAIHDTILVLAILALIVFGAWVLSVLFGSVLA